MERVRDYNEIVKRMTNVGRNTWCVSRVGEVWDYPVFCAQRKTGRGAPTIMLSAGMHGEEPAGVEGVLRWLEGGAWKKWDMNWFVLPCINPYGWERNQRTNAQRRDINRHFHKDTDTPEAELVKRLVRGRRFLCSIEFHEDVGASGYYLYEGRHEPPFIGEKIVSAVSRVMAINRDAVIDGNPATGRGLIRRDPSPAMMRQRRRWPMAYHLLLHCTRHVLGSETPVHVPLERRARAHNAALRAALTHLAV